MKNSEAITQGLTYAVSGLRNSTTLRLRKQTCTFLAGSFYSRLFPHIVYSELPTQVRIVLRINEQPSNAVVMPVMIGYVFTTDKIVTWHYKTTRNVNSCGPRTAIVWSLLGFTHVIINSLMHSLNSFPYPEGSVTSVWGSAACFLLPIVGRHICDRLCDGIIL